MRLSARKRKLLCLLMLMRLRNRHTRLQRRKRMEDVKDLLFLQILGNIVNQTDIQHISLEERNFETRLSKLEENVDKITSDLDKIVDRL